MILFKAQLQMAPRGSFNFQSLQPMIWPKNVKAGFINCCNQAADRGDTGPGFLVTDLKNCAKHWASDHSEGKLIDPTRDYVVQNWDTSAKYFDLNSPTYEALVVWLDKHITPSKMKHYVKCRENVFSETFHSLINKYASKHIHWRASHHARLACTALDWNENRSREVLAVRKRVSSDIAVRNRPTTYRILSRKTELWKEKVAQKLFRSTEGHVTFY
jgi:hypothetical protein